MQIKDKTYRYHLIWAWVSLAVNDFLMWFILYSVLNKREHLWMACVTAIGILLQGAIMVWSRTKSEYTSFVAVTDYICVGIFSLLFIFYSYKQIGILAIVIVAVMISESAIAVIISYRFRMLNWLKKLGAKRSHHS